MSAMALATTDLLDAHEAELELGTVRVLQPRLPAMGRHRSFAEPIVTLKHPFH